MTTSRDDFHEKLLKRQSEITVAAPRSLVSRGSRAVREEIFDEETGEWRVSIRMSRRKLMDTEKGVFLDEYAQHGRIGEAAAKVGVSTQTVRNEMARDEDFAEAVMIAEETYRDRLIGHHQNLLFNGTIKETYGKNGEVVSREQIFPIRLIELELKKHDSGYRDKQEVAVSVTGGVLVAPAAVASIDDWEKRFSQATDVTPIEDKEDSF